MRYVEFCAGIGGMRSGLDAAGWKCRLAIDNDADAVAVHRLAHGDILQANIEDIKSEAIPECDVWVAGFPCQPFSSSGNRKGFGHKSGNVFEHIVRLLKACIPPIVLLENVEGLLTNKGGHTISKVLASLTELNYTADWILLNLRWLGPPQTRPRLFLLAVQPDVLVDSMLPYARDVLPGFQHTYYNNFAELITANRIGFSLRSDGSLADTESELRPKIGKPQTKPPYVFGTLGRASGDRFESFDTSAPDRRKIFPRLGRIVAPNFDQHDAIRSIRYWTTDSGRGPTKVYVRNEQTSHCIGTSIGGAPLFAVPLAAVKNKSSRDAFLEFSNWYREEDDMLVMRLLPHRAVKLFGSHTIHLQRAIKKWQAGDTRKYKLVGNLVAPVCAKEIGQLVNQQLTDSFRRSRANGVTV